MLIVDKASPPDCLHVAGWPGPTPGQGLASPSTCLRPAVPPQDPGQVCPAQGHCRQPQEAGETRPQAGAGPNIVAPRSSGCQCGTKQLCEWATRMGSWWTAVALVARCRLLPAGGLRRLPAHPVLRAARGGQEDAHSRAAAGDLRGGRGEGAGPRAACCGWDSSRQHLDLECRLTCLLATSGVAALSAQPPRYWPPRAGRRNSTRRARPRLRPARSSKWNASPGRSRCRRATWRWSSPPSPPPTTLSSTPRMWATMTAMWCRRSSRHVCVGGRGGGGGGMDFARVQEIIKARAQSGEGGEGKGPWEWGLGIGEGGLECAIRVLGKRV